jgi:hypothetical protein
VGKLQPGTAELNHHAVRRPDPLEGLEQAAQGLLNLLVWVQAHTLEFVVTQPNRQWASQFTSSGFIEKSTAHARS